MLNTDEMNEQSVDSGLDDAEPADGNEPKTGKTAWVGGRLVALITAVAVCSLLAGVGAMQFIVSPADLAARTAAPKAGPVTAAVEKRVVENTIVARGEITYADAVAVNINTESGDRPVVTGHVPEVGAVLDRAQVGLEIAGRPAIVLPGELPAYRTLSVGMRGPDVVQLKKALDAQGWYAGNLETDLYEYDTAQAVRALYEHVGYAPATGGEAAKTALHDAERAVRNAQTAAAQAQATLDDAKTAGNPTLGVEQASVNAAREGLREAQAELVPAQEAVLPRLPASEVVFLSGLPRRVDTVSVKRGDILTGSPMQVSGASLALTGTFAKKEADLLSVGSMAYYPGPDGTELAATVQKIEAAKANTSEAKGDQASSTNEPSKSGGAAANSKRSKVTFSLIDLTPEQVEALRGTNVRIRLPISATEGEVIAVPVAALSAGAGGESRVELLTDPSSGAEAATELIPVETGLAAAGFVEIRSPDERIVPGAKVVVGR